MVCMKTTHKSIRDLPVKKAKQSRPTREEILEGIGYTPLTFPESLHVPEAVRAAEDLARSSVGRRDSGITSTRWTLPLTANGQDVPVRKHFPPAISPTRSH